MRLALLGSDPDAVALLSAAVRAGHEVMWLGDIRAEEAAAVRELVPHVAASEDWELLLDHALVDGVLVGRGAATDDLRAEQLKRLVADAVPLLVVHPTGSSVLTYYELDMVRREVHGIVRHYNPVAGHPATADLARWVREGHEAIGRVHQVTCERSLADATRLTALGHMARDAELLRAVVGDIRSTSAIGPRDLGGSFASLQVQMATEGDVSMRWSVAPAAGQAQGATLSLVGERGTIALAAPADQAGGSGWELCTVVDGRRESASLEPWDSAGAAIEALAGAIDAQDGADSTSASTWEAATEAMEVVDAVELSLQKGRSVDVHHQQLTDRLAFRGTMAALGCGLLLVGLAVMVVAGVLGDVLRVPLVRHWPIVLVGVLMFFLLLQIVPFLVTKRK